MAFDIDLFSPETYAAFTNSSRSISGFRKRQRNIASRIQPGDGLICYVTKLSRWVGYLKVNSGPFEDSTPIFVDEDDPFVVRFNVEPAIWLSLEKGIPIHDDGIWRSLSFTRELNPDSIAWTERVRSSLGRLEESDGGFLVHALTTQSTGGRIYALDEQDIRRSATHTVVRPDKTVTVSVPDKGLFDEEMPTTAAAEPESRESSKMQALLARIGAQMGIDIWIPKADRNAIRREWASGDAHFLERLPLNYDDTTLRTIEQIDVLWLRKRSIVRAFEVEHTTSVYSGILRMADLLALQPNMDIKLHMAESCTLLTYDSIEEIAQLKHLNRTSDLILDDYAEEAE